MLPRMLPGEPAASSVATGRGGGRRPRDHFRCRSAFESFDNATTSALTHEWLGWTLDGPALIADFGHGHYLIAGVLAK